MPCERCSRSGFCSRCSWLGIRLQRKMPEHLKSTLWKRFLLRGESQLRSFHQWDLLKPQVYSCWVPCTWGGPKLSLSWQVFVTVSIYPYLRTPRLQLCTLQLRTTGVLGRCTLRLPSDAIFVHKSQPHASRWADRSTICCGKQLQFCCAGGPNGVPETPAITVTAAFQHGEHVYGEAEGERDKTAAREDWRGKGIF